MVTASAFLLRREGPGKPDDTQIDLTGKRTGIQTHTLALFGSGVLVLGLDAYLFGNSSAMAPVVNSDRMVPDKMDSACAIAWTQAMPASSMLAIGACLMLAGLAWMLAQYFVSQDVPSTPVLTLPGF
jgi:hypothetical protein